MREETLGPAVEVSEGIGLQSIGQDAEQQMARQMGQRPPPGRRLPPRPQAVEIETAKMRDLGLEAGSIERAIGNG